MLKFARALALSAFAIGMTVAPAFAAISPARALVSPAGTLLSPAGTWQTASGESRFEVSLCGDGTQVCAKLVWLRSDARTSDTVPYLNTYVLRGATQAVANKWRGDAEYMGENVKGTLTLLGADTMTLNGCKGMFCQKVELHRL